MRHLSAACTAGGASIGLVWTRHLAPAAPASRPSLPSQFLDCACHSDSAMQFLSLPSALNGVRVGLPLQGSGHRRGGGGGCTSLQTPLPSATSSRRGVRFLRSWGMRWSYGGPRRAPRAQASGMTRVNPETPARTRRRKPPSNGHSGYLYLDHKWGPGGGGGYQIKVS